MRVLSFSKKQNISSSVEHAILGVCATSARPKKAVRKRRSESGLDFSSAAMTYGIYLHGWLISIVNVGKYTSPMDPMG